MRFTMLDAQGVKRSFQLSQEYFSDDFSLKQQEYITKYYFALSDIVSENKHSTRHRKGKVESKERT